MPTLSTHVPGRRTTATLRYARQNIDNWKPNLVPEICTEAPALHFTPAVVIPYPVLSPSLSSMTAFAVALKIYSAGRSCDVRWCTASSAALVQWEGPNTLWRSTDMHLREKNFVDTLYYFLLLTQFFNVLS